MTRPPATVVPAPEIPARREFLRQLGRTGAAIAVASGAGLWLRSRDVSEPESAPALTLPSFAIDDRSGPRMAIVHGAAVEAMVRAAFAELGGASRFIRQGDVVLVKPNVAFDRGPLLGATTHPDVVAAIVRECRGAGARKVIVADNPINSPEGAFYKSGILAAAEASGAVVMYPRANDFAPVNVGGEVLRRWPVFHRAFDGVTKVIGVAPVKDHSLCGASLTMKNWYGLLGGPRNQLHQKIHQAIADLGHMIRPTVVFLDATRILMTNGPTGGSLSDVVPGNTIAAGIDPVAIDAYGYTLLGRDPAALEYLRLAEAAGLGNRDWRSLIAREVNT